MTTAVALTTSWQKIADAGSVLISFEVNGTAEVGFSDADPTGADFHSVDGVSRIGGIVGRDVYARLSSTDDTGHAKVDQFPDPVDVGSGLSLISIAANVSLVSL